MRKGGRNELKSSSGMRKKAESVAFWEQSPEAKLNLRVLEIKPRTGNETCRLYTIYICIFVRKTKISAAGIFTRIYNVENYSSGKNNKIR